MLKGRGNAGRNLKNSKQRKERDPALSFFFKSYPNENAVWIEQNKKERQHDRELEMKQERRTNGLVLCNSSTLIRSVDW